MAAAIKFRPSVRKSMGRSISPKKTLTNRVIWKSRPIEGSLMLPKGYNILSCQMQDGLITFWFECNPKAKVVKVPVYVRTTGNSYVPNKSKYYGTFDVQGYVTHVFV